VASQEVINRATLRRRLLMCMFALGANMGLKARPSSPPGSTSNPTRRGGTCAAIHHSR
jgi:hypothetical protein